jgi:hypothetical protein
MFLELIYIALKILCPESERERERERSNCNSVCMCSKE